MTDLESTFISARRSNMDRYDRLLRTPLTDIERAFVLRRIREEKAALQDLLAKRSPTRSDRVPTRAEDALA